MTRITRLTVRSLVEINLALVPHRRELVRVLHALVLLSRILLVFGGLIELLHGIVVHLRLRRDVVLHDVRCAGVVVVQNVALQLKCRGLGSKLVMDLT